MKKIIYILAFLPLISYSQSNTGWLSFSSQGAYYSSFSTSPDNTYDCDDAYASRAGTIPVYLIQLDLEGIESTGIPSDATINGIEVKIDHYSSGTNVSEYYIKMYSNSSTSETSTKAVTAVSSEASQTLGSSSDLWGVTWVPADFSDDEYFYVYLRHDAADAASKTLYVDCIEIKIHYTADEEDPSNIFFWHNF